MEMIDLDLHPSENFLDEDISACWHRSRSDASSGGHGRHRDTMSSRSAKRCMTVALLGLYMLVMRHVLMCLLLSVIHRSFVGKPTVITNTLFVMNLSLLA